MPEAFSLNREFDFVRLDGLTRVTGRPAHEWDIYIIKELIDNAIDADESLWNKDKQIYPIAEIKIEYIDLPSERRQLIVQVKNRAYFPSEMAESIFDPKWYTSRKTVFKGVHRGSLGNALKTLLGIPYALRRRVTGDFSPELKPMSISCSGQEILPKFIINTNSQNIKVEIDKKKSQLVEGTLIRVGLDQFLQEKPRQLCELQELAAQYRISNPHVHFQWSIEINGDDWVESFAPDTSWIDKFGDTAPISWYSIPLFQDLLNALYRKQHFDQKNKTIDMRLICKCFLSDGENQNEIVRRISKDFNSGDVTLEDIDNKYIELNQILQKHLPEKKSQILGKIGEKHISRTLKDLLDIEGDILYSRATDEGDEPSVPFVLEIAVAKLRQGKRTIWTSINFSPTYLDPFFRKWLIVPSKSNEKVLGLRGFLDKHNFSEDIPMVLFFHLICPSVEHDEFSKTEINHLPFKKILTKTLDDLLVRFVQTDYERERAIEDAIFTTLDQIQSNLSPDEKFIPEQLLEKLYKLLSQNPDIAKWLETPSAKEKMFSYIVKYQSTKSITYHVAQAISGVLYIPAHPEHHFSIPIDQLSNKFLETQHVNKILYTHAKEIEPVIIENGWLSKLDMALLSVSSSNLNQLEPFIIHCASVSDYLILFLHNSDDNGTEIFELAKSWFEKQGLSRSKLIDLGINGDSFNEIIKPKRLVEFMPSELFNFISSRFFELGIPTKCLPENHKIRDDIKKEFEKLILAHIWDGMSQELRIVQLLQKISDSLSLPQTMQNEELDKLIENVLTTEGCAKSYDLVLREVVEKFYEQLMLKNGDLIKEIFSEHIKVTRVKNQ